VGDRGFGLHIFDKGHLPLIDRVLSESEHPLDSVAAQIVTLEIYDEECGIYDTSTVAEGQFSLVSLHEAEDLSLADPYERELDKYLNANVLKYTGTTWDSFLTLPRDKCEKLLTRCDALANKEAEEAEAAMQPVRDKLPTRAKSYKPRR
jgi:hypothetical protein